MKIFCPEAKEETLPQLCESEFVFFFFLLPNIHIDIAAAAEVVRLSLL